MNVYPQYKILSIDGGGIRGLIPALVLAEIERRTGKRIAEMFDMIAGTSTGGILGLGLAIPGDNGKPKYSAQELVQLYRDKGSTIFSRSSWQKLRSVSGIRDEKFSQEGVESVLKHYFGNYSLSDTLVDVLITSYDLERRSPYFFKSSKAKEDEGRNFLLWEAARATSAAPTYFEPLQLFARNNETYRALVDGGVFANNPSMCAFAEASSYGHSDLFVVSLGTGETNRPFPYNEAKDWGLIQWIKPIIDIMMDGNSDTVSYQIEQVISANPKSAYFRLQNALIPGSEAMDDASPENMQRLQIVADDLITRENMNIGTICNYLTNTTPDIA